MSRFRTEDWIPTVTDALNALRVEELKSRAAFVVSAPLPSRKAELVALLNEHLGRGTILRDLYERLGARERAAVSEVVHGWSRSLDRRRFRAKYGGNPDGGSTLSLFLYGSGVMPDDLRQRLREFVPAPAPAALTTLDDLPEQIDDEPLTVRETERAALHDLHAVLRLVESGRVSVSDRTRRPSTTAMRALAAALQGGEPYPDEMGLGAMNAFAWPMLIQAAGLAQLQGSRLGLTRAGVRALTAPAAEVNRTVWDRWLGTKLLDELSRIDVIKGQTGKGKRGLTAAPARRQAIADALAECPIARWVDVDELFR